MPNGPHVRFSGRNLQCGLPVLSVLCAAIAITIVPQTTIGEPMPGQEGAIVPSWSIPSPASANRLTLTDAMRTKGGAIVLLGEYGGRPALFWDAGEAGPGRMVTLPIGGEQLRLVEGKDGELWVGGLQNRRMHVSGHYRSQAYLVKLDSHGRIVWEKTFGVNSERSITGLSALASGDILVTGKHDDNTWLGRVSPDGALKWDRYFGLGKGAVVAAVDDNVFAVSFDADPGHAGIYREDVVFWRFGGSGDLISRHPIRTGINRDRFNSSGLLSISSAGGVLYISSSWRSFDAPQPTVIDRIDAQGNALGQWELPALRLPPRRAGSGLGACNAAIHVLSGGDAIVACPFLTNLMLYRLEASDMQVKESSMRLPSCNHYRGARVFLAPAIGDSVWALASNPRHENACAWMAKIDFRNSERHRSP